MVTDNRRIFYYICPDCNWRILNNQIRDISGYEDNIHFCEYCGSKLEKINFENLDDTEETKSENSNSIEYPVEIIANDPDFQIGFIDNLTLVLARMIYFNVRYLEKTLDKKFDYIELDMNLLNLLSSTLMPVLQDDIEEVFLDKLDAITPAEFYSNMAKLHEKVKKFSIFRQRFVVYLRWLVKQVFLLVSESWDKGLIDKFEAIIFRDLSSYNFSEIQSEIGSLEINDYKKNSNSTLPDFIDIHQKFLREQQQELISLQSKNQDQVINDQNSMEFKSQVNNVLNFQKEVKNYIDNLIFQIEIPEEQKRILMLKAEELLNIFISKAVKSKKKTASNVRPISNAAAIIYAVMVSNENIDKISGLEMGNLIGVSKNVIPKLYHDLYKDLAPKSEYNFQCVQLGRSRKILSLFFYEFINRSELDLPDLIQHLEKCDKKEIIFRLRDIFTGKEKRLTQKESQLIDLLNENEVKTYNNMSISYFKTFYKYISDLFSIISLMIVSNKSHKIIGADFISLPFVRYLMNEKHINLFQKEDVLHREIREIYDFLKDSKSKQDFPVRRKKVSTGESYWSRISSSEYSYIIGSKIKIYVAKHIYNGIYNNNGIGKCLDCYEEKKFYNITFPRLRAKSFHHQNDSLKLEKYNSENLSKLFYKNRGNPYFLSELINQMESESIVFKCRCHHRLIHSQSFFDFKKLISWEHIYSKEFPYKDIFDLPPDIIHALVKLCVDNFHKTKSKTASEKKGWIDDIIINLKKRYIIDLLYQGVCPICGEFNTRNHLPVFDFNHLYKKSELTTEELRKRKKINDLLFLPCSKFIKEMEKKYNKGAFICCNDHMVIHETYSNEIFDDKVINEEISKDHQDTIEQFKKNLIHNLKNKILIEDPLKIVENKRGPFLEFLMAIFEIMEEKGEVTTNDLMNRLKISKSTINYHFNKKQDILNTYGKLTIGKSNTPSKYYLNDKGWQLLHLFYFFRDYYRDLRN